MTEQREMTEIEEIKETYQVSLEDWELVEVGKMKYSEFIEIVKCVINNNWEYCDIDKEDEDVKFVESVTTHNFEHWETEQIYFYILGMRDLHEISNEEWRYFTEEEDET